MENKIPTAEELALQMQDTLEYDSLIDPIKFASLVSIEFAKLHVKAALKKASEDAEISLGDNWVRKQETIHPDSLISSVTIKVDDESILNSYPLTNIK